jgi:4-amino-4-deoxy-L-arabinose transferase-like glycosyltransferase
MFQNTQQTQEIQQWNSVYKNPSLLWLLFILSALSFLTTIQLSYLGEEAVYTITSMEMAQNQQWMVPTLYGDNYARPPLLNWFMIPIAEILGWDQVLMVSRLMAGVATVATGLILFWLVKKLFADRFFAVLSALFYLSGDVLFRRGWLAYADPLFSLFVFASIALLWVSLEEKRKVLLLFAILNLMASFLTKAISGYIFYAVALMVVYWKSSHTKRQFLLQPWVLILHGFALFFPFFWYKYISQSAHGEGMIQELFIKWDIENLGSYVSKLLFYPLDTCLHWLPVSGIIVYYWIKTLKQNGKGNTQKNKQAFFNEPNLRVAVWIFGLNYIPYWLAPETHTRYLMPLYPFLAIIMAGLLMSLDLNLNKIKVVIYWMVAAILLKYGMAIWGLPFYEERYRGDYHAVAQDILSRTQSAALFTNNLTAIGLSVTAHINVLKWPEATLIKPPLDWQRGFLIADSADIPDTRISKEYILGRHRLYLLCRGQACETNY